MKKYCKPLLLIVLAVFFLLNQGRAQDNYRNTGVDELFEKARTEAFDGNYSLARELCSVILKRTPDYHDVQVLVGRTYAWEGDYERARTELNRVLERTARHKDALNALYDVEFWSGNYRTALQVSDRALQSYPSDEDFMVKKARALIQQERFNRAMNMVNTLEDLNPSHPAVRSLKTGIGSSTLPNRLTGSYGYESFSRTYDNNHFGYLQWDRRTPLGPVIGRLNFSRRFGTFGVQPEIDWYPRIAGGFYGYLNYGYTSSTIFPRHRAGAEIYRRLPHGMEASLGFRHLNFVPAGNVTIYTGSLTKYFRSYYFNLRPFITPRSGGTSRSVTLSVRRFFGDPDNYIQIGGGMGVSPQERIYQSVTDDVFFLQSRSAHIGFRKNVRYDLNLFASIDYSHQELLSSPGEYVDIFSFTTGLAVKF